MMRTWLFVVLACVSITAVAQSQKSAPVEDLSSKEGALLRGQQRTGIAYREWQQAQHEAKFAEQDYLNLRDAYKAAQKRADELRIQTESAKRALDIARGKETAAHQRYEKEINNIEQPSKPSLK